MKKVIVASKNPVKISASAEGFKKMFPEETFECVGVSAPSGVAEQPMTDEETYTGATNRLSHIKSAEPEADYWIALEGGVEERDGELEVFAWMVIESKEGVTGKGKTSSFFLPRKIAELVHQGMELGHATDKVFNETDSKQKNGSIGFLTNDNVTRTTYYIEAIIIALIPFKNPSLY